MILVEFSITPIGAGESVSEYVAECLRIVRQSGLPHELTAMGTILEGEWDEVMSVIKACHMAVRRKCRRVSTLIKIDDREAPPGRIRAKVESVLKKLEQA
ncbi:MAG: MTH1187 family thiamine-binding protein [Candidatus Bipolaricaulota bacterium]|nr:MTH1187 family thiamine-binding protein [Candidatus Bipolaricaulota bacterium]MCX7844880.1 MTH1187 family thiamine-binding protein [Candidatus Bipolaricaulota bacterium]MDW8152220.1 MTH1187 family thiamine-binding protein [Candidatus Bipolaricaulota bacterium]